MVQPLPREDPVSPFELETSHSSSPQATVQQLPVLEHSGSSSQSESSDISSPQATLQQPAPHPSSPESTVQPLPREDPVSPFHSETSHLSSPQATVQQVLEHPGSPLQSESIHISSLQATLQQPAPPPLFMHPTLLKLWLRRWWIICMIAAIGLLFLISWSIHTSQKNDANIWCTTPNATVTKESNAPSSTVQGAPILFRTIMAAVDAAPGDNEWPFCILIQKGVYKERIVIERNKRNLVLVGEGINKTIISSNGAVLSTDRYISELATIWVLGKRFKAMDISFENMGADQLESVALKNSGDQSIFHRCSFMSQQVSIHSDHVGQQLYHDCYISGSQHLIYGDGHAMFQRSTIHVNNLKPEVGAVIALQERRSKFLVGGGFVFHLCTFSASTQKAINYLGASSGPSSLIVIMQSYLDRSISPLGWLVKNRTRSIYFGEYQNTGPGARLERTSPNFHHISLKDASSFTIRNFLSSTVWILCKDIHCKLDLA
ncbi:hypothetical protein VitviT2T_006205 [Vitis vinifera]|nr:putative pectinesterase 14 isoform X1 [Vitis vinifera]WJZ86779.1 hypothetical protein VitviT2T_006205 [Vitis vinifera]